ncbi:MAG: Ig-like domain-containing protein [Colwellia sp.]|nr:Ig-like domain-containing protein [Colwellia sp.]
MELLRRFSFTLLLMTLTTLVACGGGDGSLAIDGNNIEPDVITLSIAKSEGELAVANDIIVSVTVMLGGQAQTDKLVTFFLTDSSVATFSPEVGTAVTDSNGVASIRIKATSIAGGVEITANYGTATSVVIAFNSVGDAPDGETSAMLVELTLSPDKNVSATNPLTITATVRQDGAPVTDALVTFTLDNTDLASFSPQTGTANTNNEGIATILLTAGGSAGAGEISASIAGVELAKTTFDSAGDGNPDDSPNVANIALFASSQQLASSGAQEIELIAIAKDVNNNLLADVNINFSADSGDIEQVKTLTGIDGKATVKLKTEANNANRVITTIATSGSASDSLEIQVVGTTVTLTGSSSLAVNDGNNFIIKVLDSDGEGIANTIVTLSLTNESTDTPTGDIAAITLPESTVTDHTGQATVIVIGTTGGTNTIVAAALGANAGQSVAVQADSFLFTSFTDGVIIVNPSDDTNLPDVKLAPTEAIITLTWLRSGVAVDDGTNISFTTTRGTLAANSATTLNGMVIAKVSSSDAGKALVTFVGIDTVDGKNIELTNQIEFEFVADTAATIKAQASPNSIGPDGQTSTISVVVKDVNGNLVKGKTIKFELTDTSGGSIFPATAVTDSSGSASTVYTSLSTSAQDAVTIATTVVETPAVTDTVTLTVAERGLFISLGTGNKVEELGTDSYVKEYAVFVTDANSNPIANEVLTISAIPYNYYKGFWIQTYDGDEFISWVAVGENSGGSILNPRHECLNEDVNLDGILDVGEDNNGDGKLTPGNIVAAQDSIVTDEDGRAVVRIIYPQSYAHWSDIKLIASTKVSGTENSAQTIFSLPVLAAHVLNENVSPPTQGVGTNGPFGLRADCSLNISDD